MKVRIKADGTPRGTRIFDEAGNDISKNVTEVAFKHQAGGSPEIAIGIMLVTAVIEGEAKMYGADGREVRKVIYADGSEQEF